MFFHLQRPDTIAIATLPTPPGASRRLLTPHHPHHPRPPVTRCRLMPLLLHPTRPRVPTEAHRRSHSLPGPPRLLNPRVAMALHHLLFLSGSMFSSLRSLVLECSPTSSERGRRFPVFDEFNHLSSILLLATSAMNLVHRPHILHDNETERRRVDLLIVFCSQTNSATFACNLLGLWHKSSHSLAASIVRISNPGLGLRDFVLVEYSPRKHECEPRLRSGELVKGWVSWTGPTGS